VAKLVACEVRKPWLVDFPPFLVVKANAGQLPIKKDSVGLVIATPPYIGARVFRNGDYCTSNPKEYKSMIDTFLAEAIKMLKPYGHLLITSSRPPSGGYKGGRKIVFRVLQKRADRGGWISKPARFEIFFTHYMLVEPMCWWALPIRVYQSLLQRYSAVDDVVAHVFSGTGNGGIAALELRRKVVLIDLHYHRDVMRRLNRKYRLITVGKCLGH